MIGLRTTTAVLILLGSPGLASASDFWDEVKNPGLRRFRIHVAEARVAMAARRWQIALDEANAAIERVPNRAEALALRGRALGELARMAGAIEALERALALDETALDSFQDGSHAARLAASAGRYALAARILRRVLGRRRINRQHRRRYAEFELYALLGDVLLALGRDELRAAIVAYRECVRRTGRRNVRASLGLALALDRDGERYEAERLLSDAARLPYAPRVLEMLPMPETERAARRALLLEARGDRNGARIAWQAAARGEHWRGHAQARLTALGQSR